MFLQSFARGAFGRQHFVELRANVRATTIRRIVRGWLARRRYHKVRHGIIKLQAHVRRHAAKKELKRLKVSVCSVAEVIQTPLSWSLSVCLSVCLFVCLLVNRIT